ncbi:ABC transporter permease [Bacteroidota bacterium]
MLWNYLKIGYRSILKHKLSSFINTIGLGIAFGWSLVLFSFLDRAYHMEVCHENADRIFQVESVIEQDGIDKIYGTTPYALGPAIKDDFPEVEEVVRMQYSSVDFRYEDKVFNEGVFFVDDCYLDMFSYKLKFGSRNVLKQKDKIVLSEHSAIKYFGNDPAVGKQVSMLFKANGKEFKETYIVGAVADKFPYSASIRFNILIPFDNMENLGFDDDGDWENFTEATFVMFHKPVQFNRIENSMNNYTEFQNQANPDMKIKGFLFDPLPTLALKAFGKEDMLVYNAHPTARIVMSIIAVFIMVLSVINYINISIVSATSRLKEIGIRKVIGGSRKQIILQFISENALLCLLALIFGWVLAGAFLLPLFNAIGLGYSPLIFEYDNPRLWIFFSGLFVIVGIGSAAYPAFFISGFNPVNIFKGNLRLTNRNYLTKSMLAVQFIISFVTISLGVVFVLNEQFIKNRDWGYDKEQTVIIPLAYNDQYVGLRDKLTQNPDINIITGSRNHIGRGAVQDAVTYNSEEHVSRKVMAGYDYPDALGIRLKSGRFFEKNSSTDMNESIVVNEAFVNKLGLEYPIGKRIIIDSTAHYIVGVTEDFHYRHFRHKIQSLYFKVAEEKDFNRIVFRTMPGKAVSAEVFARNTWKNLYPDNTYKGYFQNAAFDGFYKESEGTSNLMMAIASIAVLISCMGLFGLVSLFVAKRMKEFSIRKVMGASTKEISLLISKGFMWVIIIASIIGIPLAYIMLDALLKSVFSYHTPLNAIPFVLTAAILILTALATVSSQIMKTIKTNPADQLRNE